MATRSFLLDTELTEAQARLDGPGQPVFPTQVAALRRSFSIWLEERLLARFKTIADFKQVKPIVIGSWARHELCPKSDIDLLCLGPESAVQEFTAAAFRQGLKLRARTPQDLNDWRVGVDPFDILALNRAQAFYPEEDARLNPQRQAAFTERRVILKAIREERNERHRRQDSISSYLEPNLKFGAGGLRDIGQALALRDLFPEKFADTRPYPFEVLETIKEEWLYLRCQLHLAGSGDILSAHDQLELAAHLKFESGKALMKFVQSELERASFYADWACANALASPNARARAKVPLLNFTEALTRLKAEPSLLGQFELRLKADALIKPLSLPERGKALQRAIFEDGRDAYFLALYRTRALEVLIPDLKRLKGLVQHDHYHRFTADAHLMQTLREVQRAKSHKRGLGPLAKLSADLSAQEWWILKLTALFHDLAKGRKGDHATEGAKLVAKYFKDWEYPDALRDEVQWLVENHLILSTAAFRQNPQAPATWKRLFERGVTGRRLILLGLFTAIDIRSTNPEAWTDWKAQLLLGLVENLRSPQALGLQRHLKYATEGGAADLEDWLLSLDPVLLQSLPPKVLVEDLKAASLGPNSLPPKVIRSEGRIWVRFHRTEDQTGIFLSFVQRLYGLGLNIQLSSVSTLTKVGVYDWFCLRTEKSVRQVSTWLNLKHPPAPKLPIVQFQSIELMTQDKDEWIISFRGRDQRGLLLSAATALAAEKLSLRWARAHTWGQQIDDIFSVQPLGEVEPVLKKLRDKFVT